MDPKEARALVDKLDALRQKLRRQPLSDDEKDNLAALLSHKDGADFQRAVQAEIGATEAVVNRRIRETFGIF